MDLGFCLFESVLREWFSDLFVVVSEWVRELYNSDSFDCIAIPISSSERFALMKMS